MIYPNKDGATFNFDYYLNRHIPRARKLVPDRGTEIRRGVLSPNGNAVPYLCLCRFWINSEEEYQTAWSKHGKELTADIPNFTNVQPVVQIDEVLLNTEMQAAA